MSQCAVYIYEDKLTSVSSSTIEIVETNYSGKKIDIQPGAIMGSEFGAKINLPNPPEPINIWVYDNSGTYSPAALGQLNGQVTARLDVIVYGLPARPGGGGTGANWEASKDNFTQYRGYKIDSGVYLNEDSYAVESLDAIASHINQRIETGDWSNIEAMGVRNLLDSANRALNCPQLDVALQNQLEKWRQQLKSFGIEIPKGVILAKEKQGGHSQGGSGMMEASS